MSYGQFDAGTDSNEFNALSFLIQQALMKMQTITLVKVVGVHGAGVTPTGTVDVQPMVNQMAAATNGTRTAVAHGTIYGVPFFRLQGGPSAIVCDPVVGDIGLCGFASRDISSVKANKDVANPGSQRVYDWADGLYLGGYLNGAPTQYLQMLASAGGIKIVTPGDLTLDSPLTEATGDLKVDGDTNLDGDLTVGGSTVLTGPTTAAAITSTGVITAAGFSGPGGSSPAGPPGPAGPTGPTGPTGPAFLQIDGPGGFSQPNVDHLIVAGAVVASGTSPNVTLTFTSSAGGTVTQVALANGSGFLTITGSPITTSGTIGVDISASAAAALAVTAALAVNALQPKTGLAGTYNNVTCTIDAKGQIVAISTGSGGGGSAWSITDGTHTVAGVTSLAVAGATVGGTSPNATLTVVPGSSLSVTDGTTTVANVDDITVVGGVVSGTTPNVTITVEAGPTIVGANITPDTHPQFPTPQDDEFEGTALDLTKWSWGNQGGTVAVLQYGGCQLQPPISGSSEIHSIEQAIPAPTAPWRFRTKMSNLMGGNYNNGGFVLRESATGKLIRFTVFYNGGGLNFEADSYSNYTTAVGALGSATLSNLVFFQANLANKNNLTGLYMELSYDGTDYTLAFSTAGYDGHFQPVYTNVPTQWFTAGADFIGLYACSQNGTVESLPTFDYFRNLTNGYVPGGTQLPTVFLNANQTPDTHPLNPTPQDDEFEASTLNSRWTWFNQSTGFVAFSGGTMTLVSDLNPVNSINSILQPIPASEVTAGAWKYRVKMAVDVIGSGGFAGFSIYEAGSDKMASFGVFNAPGGEVIVATGTIAAGYTAVPFTGALSTYMNAVSTPVPSQFFYWEIELAGGTLFYRLSNTGAEGSFATLYSISVTSEFTTHPDHIGFSSRAANGTITANTIADWFRNYTNGYIAANGTTPAIAPYNVTPDTHTNTATFAVNDEFEEPGLDTVGGRFPGASPWTWVNQNAATANLVEGSLIMACDPAASGDNNNIILQPLTAPTWTMQIKYAVHLGNGGNGSYTFIVRNSANGRYTKFGVYNPGGAFATLVQQLIDPTHFNANTLLGGTNFPNLGGEMAWLYMQVVYDGTSLYYSWSLTGIAGTFVQVYTETVASWLAGITDVGLCVNQNSGSGPPSMLVDWFRRIA